MPSVTPEQLLAAYTQGYFPMADSRDDDQELMWFNPKIRGILPLNDFHIPKRLKDFMRKEPFDIRVDTAFEEVMRGCAEPRPGHPDTWINDEILALYCALHASGHAHSVECWKEDKLLGGVYGVSIGGAFFGESMFSRTTNASKVALVKLVERLRAAGYGLLDAQFKNDHLKQFGLVGISQKNYLLKLQEALSISPSPSSRFLTVSPINSPISGA